VFLDSCNSIIADKTNGTNIFPFPFHKYFNIFLLAEGAKKVDSQWQDFCNGLNGPRLTVGNDCGLRSFETWMYFFANVQKSTHPLLSSLLNIMPKATGEVLQLAVIP
jgi:hypothetical protein